MLIQSKKVWIADQFTAAAIEIKDGKITDILPYGSRPADVDYGDLRVVPGFLDIHCHGAFGFDTNDANEEGLRNWTKNKGAQPEQYIVKPTIQQFKHYQEAAKGNIRYITMATETDDDFALTRYLTENGVVVSIGHSAATYEQAVMAYAHGARSMTHVYNGMTPFKHRENGLVGAAYRIRTMYGEIICDGNHSTPAALNNYFMSKGPDYSIMVSDALMAKGSPAGSKYIFGGNEIIIYEDGSAHLTSTGGLAGSTLRLNEGLRILVEEAMVPFNYAINACTINPARCLGLDDRKGMIGVGYDADLVVLEPDYKVHQTWCRGQAQLS